MNGPLTDMTVAVWTKFAQARCLRHELTSRVLHFRLAPRQDIMMSVCDRLQATARSDHFRCHSPHVCRTPTATATPIR